MGMKNEQRVNAAGETVEFNENSQRWEPVKETESQETEAVAPKAPAKPVRVEDETTEVEAPKRDYTK